MKRVMIIFCFCACLFPAAAFAFGERDTSPDGRDTAAILSEPQAWSGAKDGQTVEVSGLVRLVGNEPFTDLLISDTDGHDWYIDSASRSLMAGLEQQHAAVRATLSLQPMTLADGTKLETRRILKNITITKTGGS
jgi:hypothetical protein